jgi:hypothetical protein
MLSGLVKGKRDWLVVASDITPRSIRLVRGAGKGKKKHEPVRRARQLLVFAAANKLLLFHAG